MSLLNEIDLIHDPNSIISSEVSITDKASMTGTCDTAFKMPCYCTDLLLFN